MAPDGACPPRTVGALMQDFAENRAFSRETRGNGLSDGHSMVSVTTCLPSLGGRDVIRGRDGVMGWWLLTWTTENRGAVLSVSRPPCASSRSGKSRNDGCGELFETRVRDVIVDDDDAEDALSLACVHVAFV